VANQNWINPAWTQVPQVKTFTITATGGGTAVWTFTFTNDDGSTATAAYTEDGSPSTTEVATGLAAAWNAATQPNMARITATNPSAGVVVLTSDTAGIPFSVALADDGTGTHTETDTTANIGNNDAALARNWSTNTVLTNSNDAIFEPGNVGLLYGLNQSSVTLADVKVLRGFNGDFGRFEFGKFHYFRIDPDSFDFRGGGSLCMFDIGSANISPYIEAYGSPSAIGRHCVYIKGSNIATLEVAKGNVGVAVLDADTATVATLLCGLLDNPQSDVDLTIGSGVTLTTLTQSAGKCTLRCAATTVNVYPGSTLITEGSGAITTLNIYAGATVYIKSSGTIGTLNLFGTADFSRDLTAKTVTTLNVKRGGKLVKHDSITISTTNLPSSSGGAVDTLTAA
jgi:hypothetical protein